MTSSSKVELDHPDGTVTIVELMDGNRHVSVTPRSPGLFVAIPRCTTRYPVELIEVILRVKGLTWLCDEITREESPGYLQHILRLMVSAHLGQDELRGARVLDFGCGSGASTMILARLFSDARFIGVDLDEPSLQIAEARRRYYEVPNVEFQHSPDPNRLPAHLGEFDVIVFSAVVEHLLPNERALIIPQVWSALRPGGVLLVSETPHRYTPVEVHTTNGLPLINYLPDPLALRFARRFSRRDWAGASWEQLLRAGIRGATEHEFLDMLRQAGYRDAALRRPIGTDGIRDEFDLWYEISHVNELPGFKARLRMVFRAIKRLTRISFTPYLAFAVEKTDPRALTPAMRG